MVAVPVDKSLAEFIGKKGSENGITHYNRKVDGNVIVALAPTNLEEKFYSLAEIMLISGQVLLSTAVIDKTFGESLIGAALLDRHVILTDDNDVQKMLAGSGIRDFEVVPREKLLERITNSKPAEPAGSLRIDIDKSFSVKGIGAVALGIVTRGRLRVHDKLLHNSGKVVEVKSIQAQDVDIKEAEPGTRVGLALKGMDSTELEKGDILAASAVKKAKSVKLKLQFSPFAAEEMKEGSRYMLAVGFSHSIATLSNTKEATFSLERPISAERGEKALLMRESSPRIFASGEVTEITS